MENIVSRSRPRFDVGGVFVVLAKPLVQQASMRIAERLLVELALKFVPKLLDKTGALVARQLSERIDDLARIHGHHLEPSNGPS